VRPVVVLALPAVLAACVHTADVPTDTAPDLREPTAKTNYSVGYQVGSDFRRQGVEIDPERVVQGIQDTLSGAHPQMTPEAMKETLAALGQRVAEQEKREREVALEKARQRDAEFLAANAKRAGVQTTASGLQYRVLTEGNGKRPGPTDTVTVHYRGTLTDGEEFDSSYRRGEPLTFQVDKVIAGWQEALQLMGEGAQWELFIPNDLAYGDRGPLAGRALVFEVELLTVQ